MKQHKDKSTGEIFISMEQFFAYLNQQRERMETIDMDDIFLERVNFEEIIKGYGREEIRPRINRFISDCEKTGINCSMFKIGKCYRITESVANLFCYLELFFFSMHNKKIKNNKWEDIPREQLVELRQYLANALYCAKLNNEEIKVALENYERTTGCPITYDTLFNTVTDAAIQYWQEGNEHKLTKAQWDAIYAEAAQVFEYRYRVAFFNHVGKMINELAEKNGYSTID